MTKVSFYNSSARNGEALSFIQAVLNKADLFVLQGDTVMNNFFAELQEQHDVMAAAMQASATKSKMKSHVDAMKTTYRAFRGMLTGYAGMANFSSYQSVQRMLLVVNRYHKRIMAGSNVMIVSSLLYSLVEELERDCSAEVEAVMYVASCLEAMKSAQKEAMQELADYKYQRKMELSAANASLVRPQLIRQFNRMASYLNIMLAESPTDYADFAMAVDAIVDARNQVIKTRRGKQEVIEEEVEAVEE